MRCDQCKFWKEHLKQNAPHKDDFEGQCRRYPPSTLDVTTMQEILNETDVDAYEVLAANAWAWPFPVTRGSDWCGEFQPRHRGDRPIQEMSPKGLSVRARKALIRSGLSMRSQITRDSLAGIKYCGEKTIQELIKWSQSNGDTRV